MDFYKKLASKTLNISEGQVTKELRRKVKNTTFLSLYGHKPVKLLNQARKEVNGCQNQKNGLE